jgi:hypothetical protein
MICVVSGYIRTDPILTSAKQSAKVSMLKTLLSPEVKSSVCTFRAQFVYFSERYTIIPETNKSQKNSKTKKRGMIGHRNSNPLRRKIPFEDGTAADNSFNCDLGAVTSVLLASAGH